MTWKCPGCETKNDGDVCVICGEKRENAVKEQPEYKNSGANETGRGGFVPSASEERTEYVPARAPYYRPDYPPAADPYRDYGYAPVPVMPPKKSHTGLIVGIIIGITAAIIALMIALAVSGVFSSSSESSVLPKQKSSSSTTTAAATQTPAAKPTPTAKPTATPTPTKTPEPEKESSYYFYKVDCTWTEANNAAKSKGEQLVSINSREEFDMLCDYAEENEIVAFWVGADLDDASIWEYAYWQDGTSISFAPWYPGEPSYFTDDGTYEPYLMVFKVDDVWYFNDAANNGTSYYPGRVGYFTEVEEFVN